MGKIYYIFLKEALIQFRYRIVWINFALTPFFMIAPYVFTANTMDVSFAESVLLGSIMWYWMGQFFWSAQESVGNERQIGTLVSLAASPLTLLDILIGYGMWAFVNNIFITLILIILFLFSDIMKSVSATILILYPLNGIYMFIFSIFFGAFALKYKKISSASNAIQQGIGAVSGQTIDVTMLPKLVQGTSYLIPLAYTIKIGRKILMGEGFSGWMWDFAILNIISLIIFIIGIVFLKNVERQIRTRGEWEEW